MITTNKYGVPQTLVNLMERDTYSRGSCHISVTQLIDAPRIKLLREAHAEEIVRDVSDSLWSLIGKALHYVAEAGADEEHLAEERLYADVMGWKLSGGIDVQKVGERIKVLDYKFTSVWAATKDKPEWARQLNVYSWLARINKGWHTEGLEVCALLRDWNRREAQRDKSYPQSPILRVPVALWSFEEQQSYVEQRIKLHQAAWRAEEWEEPLPLCTDEERWAKPGKWALMKEGGKRASALFDNELLAKVALSQKSGPIQGDTNGYRIDYRPGEQTRCLAFCEGAPWCDYAKTLTDPLDGL